MPFISDQLYCNLKVNVAVHCFLNRRTSSTFSLDDINYLLLAWENKVLLITSELR